MPVSRALRDALRWGPDEEAAFAEAFLDHKVFAYVETLHELLLEHGADVMPDDLELSDAILRALIAEADAHARAVVDTYNRELDGFLARNEELSSDRLLDTFEAWSSDRAENRAELIAITEAYSASADATLAFHAANPPLEDDEELYDFVGDAPVCDLCKALEATNPHPRSLVLEIGSPHPQCRQEWRRRGGTLGPELRLPTEPAGMVGSESFVIRAGGHDQAIARLSELQGTEPEPA